MFDKLGQEITPGCTILYHTGGKNHSFKMYYIISVNKDKNTFNCKSIKGEISTKKTASYAVVIDDIIKARPELFI